ncbi:MAG: hypothetical protein ACI36T_01220, partial [Eggerthellaceae bacterium]
YYSVADLQNDFEANEMRAKENHEDELVQIEGYIVSIESNGSYITLDSTTNSFYLNGIDCWPDTDEIKASFTNYSVGDWVCIQGEITSVSGFGSYYDVEIHRFL